MQDLFGRILGLGRRLEPTDCRDSEEHRGRKQKAKKPREPVPTDAGGFLKLKAFRGREDG